MSAATFHSSNNLVPEFFKTTLRPHTSDSKYNPRLDDTTCVRTAKSFYEKRNCSNLGPGSYDSQSSFRPLKSAGGIAKTYYPPEKRIQAPPPGHYNLPRIMSPGTVGSEIGVEVSSPFKSHGRGLLMLDGERYNTLREDKKFSNLGPGYYDLRDDWVPSSFTKYGKDKSSIKKQAGEQFMLTLNRSTNSITHKDKPWQQKRKAKPKKDIAANPFDTSDTDAVSDYHREMSREIQSVRNLPEYYN